MCLHNGPLPVDFAHAVAKVSDQLIGRGELPLRGDVAVEVADKANSERDVIQVIAVDVAAIDLANPPITNLHLAIAGRGPVPYDEVIRETVRHFSDTQVVIIERLRVPLPRARVMDN